MESYKEKHLGHCLLALSIPIQYQKMQTAPAASSGVAMGGLRGARPPKILQFTNLTYYTFSNGHICGVLILRPPKFFHLATPLAASRSGKTVFFQRDLAVGSYYCNVNVVL